jgi:katanin p60 ATPase-containing subunit A1
VQILRATIPMATDESGIDLDAFAQLLHEEGIHDEGDVEGTEEGEMLTDEVVDVEGKGAGRLYPPRRVAPKAAVAPRPHASAAAPSKATPSYMRPTVTSSGYGQKPRSPAASTGSSGLSHTASSAHSSVGSNNNKPATPGTPSTARSTGGHPSHPGKEEAPEQLIAGKTPFSSLPENAARAEHIRNVEATITEAVGAGKVLMDDVVGLEDAKRALEEAITFPRVMAQLGTPLPAPKGILLYGPPGTGKTQLARAQATSAGCCFFAVTASSIMSKWLGDSEKLVRALFDAARYYAPAIVFIDEVDALTGSRDGSEHEAMLRVKNELLSQLDGMSSGSADPDKMVLVLGATNRPWALDEAFRRRFEKRVLIPLPDFSMRQSLFQKSTRASKVEPDVDFGVLAVHTDGYNCSDIVLLCRDAAVGPLRELSARMKAEGIPVSQMLSYVQAHGIGVSSIGKRHFDDALRRIKSSVGTKDTIEKLDAWSKEFGST